MKLKSILLPPLLAFPLMLAAPKIFAQQGLDEGGFTPRLTDDDASLYLQTEIDYTDKHGGELRWDVESWFGDDYHKLWLLSEGTRVDGDVDEAQLQLLYGRYLATSWDWRVGLRHDIEPRSLSYAVLGLQGQAPYRLETEAALYVSEDGDVSAQLKSEHAILLTQKLIAKPYVELELFAQDVEELGKGSGLTEIDIGLQLRYEIRREIAPYVDLGYIRLFGETADLAQAEGTDKEEFIVRAGLRLSY